jgi:AcrR family transcriptional regulator
VDVKQRKSPRQARARATVAAIVEATIQLLLKEGYDRFTTARAAERAGVSVGSLYQYFPNKAALACAVIDRCCEDFLVGFERALSDQRQATLAECVRAIVDVTLGSNRLTPDLHRIVNDLAPRMGVADRTGRVSRTAANIIETMLRKHSDEIAPEIDLAMAATIIETVLEALTHRVLLANPATGRDGRLAEEATRLITQYLAVSR